MLKIHQGAAGPFVLTGAGGYRQVQTAKGKLFAFDTSKSHILTCGPHGGVIYKAGDFFKGNHAKEKKVCHRVHTEEFGFMLLLHP